VFNIVINWMISVEEAKALLAEFEPKLSSQTKAVSDSLGHVLSENVSSPINMPPFPQSAMDGYALGGEVLKANASFKVIGEVAAGSSNKFQLGNGEAVRIFTGAPVPESATAVVQQEWVERDGDSMTITRDVKPNMHIRPEGEQMKSGDVALERGTLITPAGVGFLTMLGITEVVVYFKPKVTVLVTGNELVKAGNELSYGQIFESNSTMLISALQKEGINATSLNVPDDLSQTIACVSQALDNNEMLIVTGGISVGDHDHVGTALNELGVDEVFYKVAQKPGKPIFFGTKGTKAIFALPGNPAASLSCFYEYVIPAMRKASGRSDTFLSSIQLPVATGSIRSIPRAQFLKAKVCDNQVSILDGQSSAILNSFAHANALVYIPANSGEITNGTLVETHLMQ
jgi:molybdopterin molybdotransferase